MQEILSMTSICNKEDDLNIFATRRINDKEKPYECKKCGKIFAWRKAQKEYSIKRNQTNARNVERICNGEKQNNA